MPHVNELLADNDGAEVLGIVEVRSAGSSPDNLGGNRKSAVVNSKFPKSVKVPFGRFVFRCESSLLQTIKVFINVVNRGGDRGKFIDPPLFNGANLLVERADFFP
jgi:hypothetical protein